MLATKLKIAFFHISKIERTIPYSLFRSDISICVAQSQRMFWKPGPSCRGKKLSDMINDWENNISYWEEYKQSKAFACKYDSF